MAFLTRHLSLQLWWGPVLIGLGVALSQPPVGFWGGLFFLIPALFALMQNLSPKQALVAGFSFTYGYAFLAIHWLYYGIMLRPEQFGWMVPVALLGMPILVSIFQLPAFWIAWKFPAPLRFFVLALGWGSGEFVRGHLIQFPWLPLGQALGENLYIAQISSVIGVYGLTLWVWIGCALLFYVLTKERRLAAAVACVWVAFWFWGKERVEEHPTVFIPGPILRVVQPNISQNTVLTGQEQKRNQATLLNLTRTPSALPIAAVIWPESGIGYPLQKDKPQPHLKGIVKDDTLLLTGVPLKTGTGENSLFYNSVVVLDRDGILLDSYDKIHLVPFGEFMPGRKLLGDLLPPKLTLGPKDFSCGSRLRILKVGMLPAFSPLVCYEAIFSGDVIDRKGQRPGWILNVTNDGWFGVSWGPYQHLAMVRLRAIEEGVPIVRCANTGISAIFDPIGREIARLPLVSHGIIDSPLPRALGVAPLFAQYGWAMPALFGLLLWLGILGLRKRRKG